MKIKFKPIYLIGISIAMLLLVADFSLFWEERWFFPLLIICINLAWLQFWIDFFLEIKRQKEMEEQFLEFTRSLVSSVHSGIPIPQAVIQVSNDDFGALTPYIKKLANQLRIGIPLNTGLTTFGGDTNNTVIKRAVSIIIKAGESGGYIEDVLQSVSDSVITVKKMKEERKSTTYSQVVQGYIIFFVFIGIVLVLQLQLFPQLTSLTEEEADMGSLSDLLGLGKSTTGGYLNLDNIFFALVLIQGFFSGLVIGKFSEGNWKKGLMHSLVLISAGAFIITLFRGGL